MSIIAAVVLVVGSTAIGPISGQFLEVPLSLQESANCRARYESYVRDSRVSMVNGIEDACRTKYIPEATETTCRRALTEIGATKISKDGMSAYLNTAGNPTQLVRCLPLPTGYKR